MNSDLLVTKHRKVELNLQILRKNEALIYSKTCLKRPLKRKTKMGFKTDPRGASSNTFDLHLATICH